MFSIRALIYIFVALLLCQLLGKFGIVDSPMFGGIYGQIGFGFSLSLNTIIISVIEGKPESDVGKARAEITEEELNVNENIVRYKAMLKKGKKNS